MVLLFYPDIDILGQNKQTEIFLVDIFWAIEHFHPLTVIKAVITLHSSSSFLQLFFCILVTKLFVVVMVFCLRCLWSINVPEHTFTQFIQSTRVNTTLKLQFKSINITYKNIYNDMRIMIVLIRMNEFLIDLKTL